MSHILKAPFSQGYVSTGTNARAADDLDTGELTEMSGAFYRKNDANQVWKMPGRTLFGDAGSGTVKGIAICQFDSGGTDKLIASVGTSLYSASPGVTGTFSSLVTGLNSDATRLTACHQNDRWYLGNGIDPNITLMPDGTTRAMGLKPPTAALTLATSAVGLTTWRPTTGSLLPSNDVNGANAALAYDSDESTFATINTIFQTGITFRTFGGFAADGTAGRVLKILWSYNVSGTTLFSINVSQDGTPPTTAAYNVFLTYCHTGVGTPSWVEIPLTGNNSNILVGFAAQPSPLFGWNHGYFFIHDIKIELGSAANQTAATGVYYVYTEVYDQDNLESPPSQPSALLQFTSASQVVVTRPAQVNPAATHWRVYRTVDGAASTPENFGLVSNSDTSSSVSNGNIDIALTTWTDKLAIPVDEQALPITSLKTVGDLSFFTNTPPPALVNMVSWKGSVCGISLSSRRSWFYSEADQPESWPPIYTILSFPLDEHDALVGQMAVGETMVLLCEGAAIALDDLPRVTDGQYDNANARPLKGHPGCVGNYAYTTFSVSGEPRGAWVSPFGVYVTNGTVCECISTDLSWENEVNVPYLVNSVLRWDAKNLILWFEFDLDGDGLNDREMPFHMAEFHQKSNGKPKIGQPTAKATSCMASALVASNYYRYSGHTSDGSVYVEESGYVDVASGLPVTLTVKTGQLSSDKVDLAVVKGTIQHGDFGSGETCSLTTTAYRDASNTQNSKVQTVRLDGFRGTTAAIARAGELIDFEITYSGPGLSSLGGIDIEVSGQGRSGSAQRVTSNSATP
jgi:hypothetical protein